MARQYGAGILRAKAAFERGLGKVPRLCRPESVDLVGSTEGFPVVVRLVEQLGADAYLYGSIVGTQSPDAPDIVTRIEPGEAPRIGETVYLRVRPGQEHAFSPKTGLRLGTPPDGGGIAGNGRH